MVYDIVYFVGGENGETAEGGMQKVAFLPGYKRGGTSATISANFLSRRQLGAI